MYDMMYIYDMICVYIYIYCILYHYIMISLYHDIMTSLYHDIIISLYHHIMIYPPIIPRQFIETPPFLSSQSQSGLVWKRGRPANGDVSAKDRSRPRAAILDTIGQRCRVTVRLVSARPVRTSHLQVPSWITAEIGPSPEASMIIPIGRRGAGKRKVSYTRCHIIVGVQVAKEMERPGWHLRKGQGQHPAGKLGCLPTLPWQGLSTFVSCQDVWLKSSTSRPPANGL